jgi:hypothetical protein
MTFRPRFKFAAYLLVFSALGWGAGPTLAQDRPAPDPSRAAASASAAGAAEQPVSERGPQQALRHWTPRLKDLGADGALLLRGVDGWARVNLNIRRDELVDAARLHLRFTLSPALLADLSHIKVELNDQFIQTIVLPKEQLGQPHVVDIDIPPAYFTDYNQLAFQFVGHYTRDCEFPDHTSLWAEISNESYLDLSMRHLPLSNDLALLPAPFFDPRDNRAVNVPFVFAANPGLGPLKASGSIAGWLGALAAYRGSRFPVFEDQLPARNAVVFATNAQRPGFLKNLPPVEQPTLSLVAHPDVPGGQLLLVLGKDDAQVQVAADALALEQAALSGQSIHITDLQLPALRKPYDAPRWLSTERPVQLGELVKNASDLQLGGTTLHDAVQINVSMAPDLFTWNVAGIPVSLLYRYTPPNQQVQGELNVSFNDQFVKGYQLLASSAEGFKNAVLSSLGTQEAGAVHRNINIPAFTVHGSNRLKFAFQIPPADVGRCRSEQPVELRAAVDPQSTIDLTGFDHYMALPDLAAFANSGFPFTKFADLSQTSVVLPNQPTNADIEAYLTAIGRMAADTGYAGTRFKLLHAAQVDQARDTDILLVSSGDKDGLLARWGNNLPALLETGKRSVHPLERGVNRFFESLRIGGGSPATADGSRATLEGGGPLAGLLGIQSPLQAGRSVVALTASDVSGMSLISQNLNDPAKVQLLQGDLGLMHGDAVESFRIHPVYYVGDLSWYKRLWFHLHNHPAWLALLSVFAGLLLTLLVYGALRSLARRRLEAMHDGR